jgi:hypothetical protein
MPLNSPAHVMVRRTSMNADSALTQRLSSILYLWGSTVTLDASKLSANDMKRTILFSSGERSWEIPGGSRSVVPKDIEPSVHELRPYPLAVQIEGRFKSPFEGKSRPAWPMKLEMDPMSGRPMPAPPDGPETPLVASPGKLILTGCAEMFSDSFLGTRDIGNTTFLLNCVDSLTLDENLLRVRSKQPTDRSFGKVADGTAIFWRLVPLVLVPLSVIGAGLAIGVLRVRRRDAWNAAHGRTSR